MALLPDPPPTGGRAGSGFGQWHTGDRRNPRSTGHHGLNRLRLADDKAQLTDEQKRMMTPKQIAKLEGSGLHLGLVQGDFSGNVQPPGNLSGSPERPRRGVDRRGSQESDRASGVAPIRRCTQAPRDETNAANQGVNPADAVKANDAFMAGPTAQARVAAARNDAAEFVRGREQETLQIARKAAEARLKSALKLDTPDSNFEEAMGDNPATRAMLAATRRATGQRITADILPVGMGGKPTRQLRIDDEAMKGLENEAPGRDRPQTHYQQPLA